jgi:hypothetical protein
MLLTMDGLEQLMTHMANVAQALGSPAAGLLNACVDRARLPA